jgi:Tfp pilus assembly protein PilO
MTREDLIKTLTQKKVQDYSFTILFFVIFSFFVIFAIRPNVLTAFNLQKELQDLRNMDKTYEQVILSIVNYQTVLEDNRDNFYLLDEAIPTEPQTYKLIADIRNSVAESGITLAGINVNQLELKETKKQKGIQQYRLTLELDGSNEQLSNFISSVANQRRLKTINRLTVAQVDRTSSIGGRFHVDLDVEGYSL